MWCFRALYNSAIIQPDCQGGGANLDGDYFCAVSPSVLARQMEDCAMAALEVMKSRGVTLAPDGHSIVTGFSLGAAVPLLFAKYYETEAPESLRQALRLRATYTACGPLDWAATLRYFSAHPCFNAMLAKTAAVSLAAYSPEQLGGYQPQEFVSDMFHTTLVDYYGREMPYYEAEARYAANTLGMSSDMPNPRRLSEILAPDMLTADGQLDESAPKTQVMLNLMARESDLSGWKPQLPIYLEYCRQDDGIPFQTAYATYMELSRYGTNPNIHFCEMSLPTLLSGLASLAKPGLIHMITGFASFLPAYLQEDLGEYMMRNE